ncbi:HNH endonuclease [Aminipila luticellarii]|uniref:Putative HNH nuclease YajD n=1 Tax=Aminipila luticellarii TaxID=2507160 RepID=A0A410PX59_9FIRM|nr:HNH endonuclease signature motif containing protein [Aminipila luticellarii]QAT43450.1 HNH endonuclease [Aminipila luticellarii]
MNFYKKPAWIHRRESVLQRDNYICQECKRYGKSKSASIVHHIIPLAWCLIHNPALALDPINLIALCPKCHNEMHDRDSNKLTAKGIEWVKRMGTMGLNWIEKYFNKEN